ncbi:hypothetical protein TNCV_2128961 [Trichonephila clavipes]|nr:hypothetical protein TNCV_2128961 [Trichonephila clavipes]
MVWDVLGISAFGGVMDREKISLHDSRPIRKADCVSKKNPSPEYEGPSESVQEFAAHINKLGTQIFQSGNSAQNTAVRNANDQLLQSRFISGLRNEIRRFVLSRDPLNLEESINAALIEEQNMKLNQIASEERDQACRPHKRKNPVLSALADKLQEINLRVGRLQEQVQLQLVNQVGTILTEERTFSSASIVVFKDTDRRNVGRDRGRTRCPLPAPGEMPRASILLQVAPGQEGGMYISGIYSPRQLRSPGIQ